MNEIRDLDCLRCGSAMERGFLIDHTYGAKLQAKWAAGTPQYRFGGMMMNFGDGPPDEAPDAAPLATPRVALRRGLQARTFDRLRSLSMLGGWA